MYVYGNMYVQRLNKFLFVLVRLHTVPGCTVRTAPLIVSTSTLRMYVLSKVCNIAKVKTVMLELKTFLSL